MRHPLLWTSAILGVALGGCLVEASPPPTEEAPTAAPSFALDVHPIFVASCSPCHTENALAGVSIAESNQDAARENAIAHESRILSLIATGTMPLGCSGPPGSGSVCLTEEEFATIEAWYAAGSPE